MSFTLMNIYTYKSALKYFSEIYSNALYFALL